MGLFDFLANMFGDKHSADDATVIYGREQTGAAGQAAQQTAQQTTQRFGKAEVLSYNPNSCYNCRVTTENAYDYQAGVRNLYDYVGDPVNYFLDVIRTNFPEYEIGRNQTAVPGGRVADIVMMRDGRIVFALELMHQSSSRYQLCRECTKAHIGYANFYIDHPGWWNMEPYVVERIRSQMQAVH